MDRFLIFIFVAVCILMTSHATAQTEITFYTTNGQFIVQMEDKLAPITAGNFISLVEKKYYDGVIFHRVIDKFMIQGGDPTGTGSGGPGYTIPDEFDSKLSNVQKTISMANRGPNTGGSQFFINLVNNTYLDFNKTPFTSKHAVFGKVISGFEIVQAIGKVETDKNNRPKTDVVMDSLRVTKVNGISKSDIQPNRLHIYPNPINSNSIITVNTYIESKCELVVMDQFGRVVKSHSTNLNLGVNHILLSNIFDLNAPKGVYFVIFISNNIVQYRKKILYY